MCSWPPLVLHLRASELSKPLVGSVKVATTMRAMNFFDVARCMSIILWTKKIRRYLDHRHKEYHPVTGYKIDQKVKSRRHRIALNC